MKSTLTKARPRRCTRRLWASNEAREHGIAGTNEIALDGEWLKISPYGDFPNKAGLQRLQPADAETMVTAFNSLRGRAARLFLGLPIFVGHPDVEPAVYPDKRRYGKITDLAARADGLYGKVALNDLGQAAIEQGHYLFNSPAWYLKREAKFVRPVELISVGLTNTPQIPGDPWAKNETTNPTSTENIPMPPWLKDLLAARGLSQPGDSAEQMQTAINSLLALPDRVAELTGQLTAAANEQTRLAGELTAAQNRVTSLTTDRDALLLARNTRELELAVGTGRIKAADRADWLARLTADFATNCAALNALPVAVNTRSQVEGLGGRKAEVNAGGEKISAINAAVRQYAAEKNLNLASNENYNQAFAAVRQASPALFQ